MINSHFNVGDFKMKTLNSCDLLPITGGTDNKDARTVCFVDINEFVSSTCADAIIAESNKLGYFPPNAKSKTQCSSLIDQKGLIEFTDKMMQLQYNCNV